MWHSYAKGDKTLKKLWLIVLVIGALAVVACGPEMATPTPGDKQVSGGTPSPDMAAVKTATVAPTEGSPSDEAPTATEPAGETPSTGAELPVDEEDWHVLGSPDAPVTIYEYSDFQ